MKRHVTVKRPWALPLMPFYAAAVAAHGLAYRLRLAHPARLSSPVISVGSLSAGGAGKTPVVLMLAKLLERQGYAVDVLSRGYKRSATAVEQVTLDLHASDRQAPAMRFGDEPVEMAEAGLRVFVGRERLAAGQLAESRHRGDARLIHLLDDGFQHRRLARTLDIVLLTEADLRDHLLPAGNLREPRRALERADIVLLREEEDASLAHTVHIWSKAEIWRIRRRLILPEDLPVRPYLFSGIARPEALRSMLVASGVTLAGYADFPDHHAYSQRDMRRLIAQARGQGADGFLTTAKDAVKLTPAMRQELAAAGSVRTVRLEVSLDDQNMRRLIRLLAQLSREKI